MPNTKAVLVVAFLIVGVFFIHNQGVSQAQSEDNTKINQRDSAQEELTADEQGQTKEDRLTTQEIRKAVINEKSLSIYAHNIKIITTNGVVTLKGPVTSEEEKSIIEAIAAEIVGTDKVQSQIGVVSK